MAKKKIKKTSKKRAIVWSLVSIILCVAIGVGIYYLVTYKTGNKNDVDDTKENIEQTQDNVDTAETQEQSLAIKLVG